MPIGYTIELSHRLFSEIRILECITLVTSCSLIYMQLNVDTNCIRGTIQTLEIWNQQKNQKRRFFEFISRPWVIPFQFKETKISVESV